MAEAESGDFVQKSGRIQALGVQGFWEINLGILPSYSQKGLVVGAVLAKKPKVCVSLDSTAGPLDHWSQDQRGGRS